MGTQDNLFRKLLLFVIGGQMATVVNYWDWRMHDVLVDPPLKQNGTTCWAYAVSASVEGALQRLGIRDEAPSIQHLIDCCFVSGGSHSGKIRETFQFIKDFRVTTSREYGLVPSSMPSRGVCIACDNNLKPRVGISDFEMIDNITVASLKQAVLKNPVVVCSFFGGLEFRNYKRADGVLTTGAYVLPDPHRAINGHAMVLLGYGTHKGEPYWLLRNSWGADWGDNGCVKVHQRLTPCFDVAGYPIDAFVLEPTTPRRLRRARP